MKNQDFFTNYELGYDHIQKGSLDIVVPYAIELCNLYGFGVQCKRKYYCLEKFAIAGCDAMYGYKRKHNRQYRKYFTRLGIDVSECDMHHGLDGKMYAVPRKIHRAVPHFGFVAYIKRANLVSCWY